MNAVQTSHWLESKLGVPPLIRLVGKAPIDDDWPRGPRLDPPEWRARLSDWSGNLGLLCGALIGGGYLVVVDVDVRVEFALASLERLYDLGLPRQTVTVLTGGGGTHLYYRSELPVAKGSLADFPGIDIQGEGAQVVIPYSTHESGKSYEWEFNWSPDDVELAELPHPFVALFGVHRGASTREEREPAVADKQAVTLLVEHFGAHDPMWRRDHYIVTRPGKPGSSGSATVGVIGPGGVHVFTSAWPNLPAGNYSLFDLKVKLGATPGAQLAAGIPLRLTLDAKQLSEFERGVTEWLWPWRLARGTVTFLDGDPGLGKSTLSLSLAAVVTRGGWFGDGAGVGQAANVVLLTGEDSIPNTVRPRVEVLGGDPSRITVLRGHHAETNGLQFRASVAFPRDFVEFEQQITDRGAALAIVDPLAAYVRMKGDSYRDADMRSEMLEPLTAIAERTGAAILALRHLAKSHGSNPVYAGLGSVAASAAARLVLLVGAHPSEPGVRVLAVAKSNLAPIPPSLAFSLDNVEGSHVAQLTWRGESPFSAAELLLSHSGVASEPTSEVERVADWLRQVLLDNGGELPSKFLREGSDAVGFSWRTVMRARKILGLEARQHTDERGKRSWSVALPPEPDQGADHRMPPPLHGILSSWQPDTDSECQDDRIPRRDGGHPGESPPNDTRPFKLGGPGRSVGKWGSDE